MADVLEDAARPGLEGAATDILDMTQGGGPSDVEIYRKLRDAIETGRFEPGDRLPPERDLALRLGSSRNLVRRAVQRLERERRVIRHVGRGTFVAPADGRPEGSPPALSSNVSPLDVLEARMAIEPGFADLIVARASEDDFSRMESRLKAMADAPTQQEFREAGYAFHLELARTTRNPLLVRIFELIIEARAAAGWGRLRALNDTPEARAAQTAANREVLTALRDRDSELARRLIRVHLGRMVASVAFRPEQ
jgi:DNA-binding FadR family transcriptional regulator